MRCPKCQFENPDDAQFCIECGNPIEFHCPQCSAITPATGKFCKACGHNLILPSEPPSEELSFNEKIEKIQRYLPKGLTEKILSQRDRIEGEREMLTELQSHFQSWSIPVWQKRCGQELEILKSLK